MKKIVISFLLLISLKPLLAQPVEAKLEEQMFSFERDVVRIYNELQKFLAEDTRRGSELKAFEQIITIYVDIVMDIYDTLWRLKGTTLESHQDLAARCLILRALTYMERAQEEPDNYARACEDYKKALRLSLKAKRGSLLNSKLPYEIWVGKKMYTRLADLLDDRNKNFQMLDCFTEEHSQSDREVVK